MQSTNECISLAALMRSTAAHDANGVFLNRATFVSENLIMKTPVMRVGGRRQSAAILKYVGLRSFRNN